MTMAQEIKMIHYRTYMKMYGQMIMEIADTDEAVLDLINNKNLSPFSSALRERIENSPAL